MFTYCRCWQVGLKGLTQPCDLEFPQWVGRGYFKIVLLLLGTPCPKPDTWQGNLYLWGQLWSSTANKGYQTVPPAPFPPGHTHIPQRESGRAVEQWKTVSHEVRPDGVSPARLPLAAAGGADAGSWQAATGITTGSQSCPVWSELSFLSF